MFKLFMIIFLSIISIQMALGDISKKGESFSYFDEQTETYIVRVSGPPAEKIYRKINGAEFRIENATIWKSVRCYIDNINKYQCDIFLGVQN